MNEDYKELYYFLFNKISDMIQELQQLQQQAEEAYVAGFGHAPQSAAAQESSEAEVNPIGDQYVPPQVTVSRVFVPDEYEDEAISRGSIEEQKQQREASTLARCQIVNSNNMLTFERRKSTTQSDMERRKPAANSAAEREIVWRPLAE